MILPFHRVFAHKELNIFLYMVQKISSIIMIAVKEKNLKKWEHNFLFILPNQGRPNVLRGLKQIYDQAF